MERDEDPSVEAWKDPETSTNQPSAHHSDAEAEVSTKKLHPTDSLHITLNTAKYVLIPPLR